ncbi:MAG: amidohydrolase family protein [Planctomycetia bacterium]|nr:amidohydrolase family protein [Planctomycetia bacterium]
MSGPVADDLIIRCAHLLPMHGPAVENGWVRVRRGKIVALGGGARIVSSGAPVIDAGDAIVMPGLVNAHTHLEFSAVPAPLEASGGLPGWIRRVVALRRSQAADEGHAHQICSAIRAGLAESAAAGVTAIGEIATSTPADAYAVSRPRVRVFREALGLSPQAGHAALRSCIRDVDRLAAQGVATGLSPHAPYSVATPLGTAIVAAAIRRKLPLAMHVAESLAEEELIASGSGPFRELLEGLGAWDPTNPPRLLPAAEWISRLARGPRGIVVHGTYLDRDPVAMARLARHRDRLSVAVCPRTTLALSGTLPPVRLFRDAGLRVAIGTDSRASNPDLSILAECRTIVDAGLVSPAEALGMATIQGAWALGFERCSGMLAPGRPADLVILRPETRHRDPHDAVLDPATRVVATLRAGTVIAGGLDD